MRIHEWLHCWLVRVTMRYLNTADLIAMVDTKLDNTSNLSIALDDLWYIIKKHSKSKG